jgi:hypothetical protein
VAKLVLDLNKYVVNKPHVIAWYYNGCNRNDVDLSLSLLSTSTHCPKAVLTIFLSSYLGNPEYLTKIIDRLVLFYDYSVIPLTSLNDNDTK